MERTLVLIKPSGVQRGLIGTIIERFERRGLKLVGIKFIQIDNELASKHYAEHVGKAFYPDLLATITSSPVVAMVWQGPQAITIVRRTMGSTNSAEAAPGTIRADYASSIRHNLVHGSDGPESASREIALFFKEEEIIDWKRDADSWLYE
ncbi:MAG: nucleoside-diphosphate kinase [Chloroflexi bacterium]|nr:nucleoside-diphosphate kinase [Chloroflexota bacterium]